MPEKKRDSGPAPKFKVGEIVQLLSGGPAMTVSSHRPSGQVAAGSVLCVWFDKQDQRHAHDFEEATLKTYAGTSGNPP